jgi:hypothetical protein
MNAFNSQSIHKCILRGKAENPSSHINIVDPQCSV